MSTPTSIDDNGFHLAVGPSGGTGLSGWLSTLEASYTATYGSTVDVSPSSPDGQWLGILAETINDFEQLLLTVYNGRAPAGAVGAGLSRLVQVNGIARKAGQFSLAPVTLGGTPGTVVPIGRLIGSASDPTIPPFATVAAYTIGGYSTVTQVTAIQNALFQYGQSIARIGQNVNWYNLSIAITSLGITGLPNTPSVLDVFLGSAPSPTLQEDLVVPYNERPLFSTAFISVVAA